MKKAVSLLLTLALLCATFALAEGLTSGTYTGSTNSVIVKSNAIVTGVPNDSVWKLVPSKGIPLY